MDNNKQNNPNAGFQTGDISKIGLSPKQEEEWHETLGGGYRFKGGIDPCKGNPYLNVSTNETKVEEKCKACRNLQGLDMCVCGYEISFKTPPITTKAEWEKDILNMSEAGYVTMTVSQMTGYIKGITKQVEQDTEKRVVGKILKAIEPVVETRQVWQVKQIINNLKSKYE